MTQIIIKPNEQGRVVIIAPAPGVDIADLAATVQGPYRIIDTSDLPAGEEWAYSDGPISAVTRVPASISKVQFVRAARAAGLWATYQAQIEAHPDWAYVTEIPRDDQLVLDMASSLGFTDAQLDAIWVAGAAL